jgi:hypothetical protein
MLHRVALVTTNLSEERIAPIIRVTRIGEVGTLAVISNRSTLLQGPHGVTFQKTAFFKKRDFGCMVDQTMLWHTDCHDATSEHGVHSDNEERRPRKSSELCQLASDVRTTGATRIQQIL